MLELQANAISTLANNQIPGTNTWIAIIDWIDDFLKKIEDEVESSPEIDYIINFIRNSERGIIK